MGDVVAFVPKPRQASPGTVRLAGATGEIRLFDGVRIERWDDRSAPARVRSKSPRPSEPSRRAP